MNFKLLSNSTSVCAKANRFHCTLITERKLWFLLSCRRFCARGNEFATFFFINAHYFVDSFRFMEALSQRTQRQTFIPSFVPRNCCFKLLVFSLQFLFNHRIPKHSRLGFKRDLNSATVVNVTQMLLIM